MKVTRVGLDIAKQVFRVHRVDARSVPSVRRQLSRAKVLEFFMQLPPCLIREIDSAILAARLRSRPHQLLVPGKIRGAASLTGPSALMTRTPRISCLRDPYLSSRRLGVAKKPC
jgi:hypothetical protein